MSGSIIFWNRFAENLFGWPAATVLGSHIERDRSRDQEPVRARRAISPSIGSGKSWSGEFSVRRRDGSTILAQVTNSPVRDGDGKLIGIVSVATDITEEKRARSALLEEQRVLAVLNRTAAKLNAELDLTALLQAVIEAGVELTGAEFGALFSGRTPVEDDHFELYALSGIDRQSFETPAAAARGGRRRPDPQGRGHLPLGRRHDRPEICRGDRRATRCRKPPPPVRSYLAVPLVSRSGIVIGALFLGHSQAGVFTERAERIMEGIASHAVDRHREGEPLPGGAAGNRDAQEGRSNR